MRPDSYSSQVSTIRSRPNQYSSGTLSFEEPVSHYEQNEAGGTTRPTNGLALACLFRARIPAKTSLRRGSGFALVPHAFILVFDARCSGDFGASCVGGNGRQAVRCWRSWTAQHFPSLRFRLNREGHSTIAKLYHRELLCGYTPQCWKA
jgi:hypothetical protein